MKSLNERNWQYFVVHFSLGNPSKVDARCLPDYECMVINTTYKKIQKNNKTTKVDEMPVIGLKVNFYSGIVENKKGFIKLLKKATDNKRDQRARPEQNQKEFAVRFLTQDEEKKKDEKSPWARTYCAYGREWGRRYKNDEWAVPTINELLEGLYGWYVRQTEQRIEKLPKNQQMRVIKRAKEQFNEIFEMVTVKDWNKPMIGSSGIERDG